MGGMHKYAILSRYQDTLLASREGKKGFSQLQTTIENIPFFLSIVF